MTERQPSASQRLEGKVDKLEDKFDVMTVSLFSMQGDIKAILERMEMQPKIDQQSFDNLKQQNTNCQMSNNARFNTNESEIKSIRENITWLVRTVIGEVIALVFVGIGWIWTLISKA